MNKDRRKELNKARALVEESRDLMTDAKNTTSEAQDKMIEAREIVENCRDEEQEYYENMPESVQGGEKGDKAQEAVSAMDSALDADEFDFDDMLAKMDVDFESIISGFDYEADEMVDNIETAAE